MYKKLINKFALLLTIFFDNSNAMGNEGNNDGYTLKMPYKTKVCPNNGYHFMIEKNIPFKVMYHQKSIDMYIDIDDKEIHQNANYKLCYTDNDKKLVIMDVVYQTTGDVGYLIGPRVYKLKSPNTNENWATFFQNIGKNQSLSEKRPIKLHININKEIPSITHTMTFFEENKTIVSMEDINNNNSITCVQKPEEEYYHKSVSYNIVLKQNIQTLSVAKNSEDSYKLRMSIKDKNLNNKDTYRLCVKDNNTLELMIVQEENTIQKSLPLSSQLLNKPLCTRIILTKHEKIINYKDLVQNITDEFIPNKNNVSLNKNNVSLNKDKDMLLSLYVNDKEQETKYQINTNDFSIQSMKI